MTRVVAAIVALATILPILLFGGSLGVEILVPLVMLVCLWEYGRMAFPVGQVGPTLWMVVASGGLYASFLYGSQDLMLPVLFGSVLGCLLFALFRVGSELDRGADRAGRLLLGVFWIGLLVFVPLLRQSSLIWLLLALVIAWSSDTGAYFTGRALGRRPLFKSVSPNKTWEGFWGGLLLCVLSVFVVDWAADTALEWYDCVLIAVLSGCMSVLGDLTESLMKRSFGVKDSGRIMPGHGGLLDRVDSLLFVCPTLYGYLLLMIPVI